MTGPSPVDTGREPIPRWMVALGAVVVFVGVASLSFNLEGTNPDLIGAQPSGPPASGPPASGPPPSGPPPSGPPPSGGTADAAALIQRSGCEACHGPDLAGQAQYPSLHNLAAGPKSENLQQLGTDFPDTWVNLWIDGSGPEVAGLDRGGMPVFGGPDGILTSDEIATIVEYLLTLE